MDNISSIISSLALLVSVLALPMSLYVAKKQARMQSKLALHEYERRQKGRMRLLVANRLDDLLGLFFHHTFELTKINLLSCIQLGEKYDVAALEKCLPQIDSLMRNNGAADRLAKVIDEYVATGEPDEKKQSDIRDKLQEIRRIISFGYASTVITTEEYIVTGEPDDQLERKDRKTISRQSTTPPPGYYVTWQILHICKGQSFSNDLRAIKDSPPPRY